LAPTTLEHIVGNLLQLPLLALTKKFSSIDHTNFFGPTSSFRIPLENKLLRFLLECLCAVVLELHGHIENESLPFLVNPAMIE